MHLILVDDVLTKIGFRTDKIVQSYYLHLRSNVRLAKHGGSKDVIDGMLEQEGVVVNCQTILMKFLLTRRNVRLREQLRVADYGIERSPYLMVDGGNEAFPGPH